VFGNGIPLTCALLKPHDGLALVLGGTVTVKVLEPKACLRFAITTLGALLHFVERLLLLHLLHLLLRLNSLNCLLHLLGLHMLLLLLLHPLLLHLLGLLGLLQHLLQLPLPLLCLLPLPLLKHLLVLQLLLLQLLLLGVVLGGGFSSSSSDRSWRLAAALGGRWRKQRQLD